MARTSVSRGTPALSAIRCMVISGPGSPVISAFTLKRPVASAMARLKLPPAIGASFSASAAQGSPG